MTTVLVRQPSLSLDDFARAAGVHPDLARRLITLGLIEATRGVDGQLRVNRDQLAAAARVQRLRSGLAINYAAIALVSQLLDRIDELERAARRPPSTTGGSSWT